MDKAKGFQLRIAAFSEATAKELARKLIDCTIDPGAVFTEDKWSRASTRGHVSTQQKIVLGKPVKIAAKRPSAIMSLRQVDLFIPGWGSRTLIYRNKVD
jgi:hypothetical protein